MDELIGFEEPLGVRRPNGHPEPVASGTPKTWTENREAEAAELGYTKQPYVVIIGGGQGALALGARLRQLNVPTIIVEKNPKAGDSWRVRYKSLCLHDPVWYDHMPYIPFPPNWPVYAPKDKLGDWLEMYAKVMELNFWGSTLCKSAKFDETTKDVDRHRRARRQGDRPQAKAARLRHRPGQPRHRAEIPWPGHLQGRAAAFLAASRSRRLCRQEDGRHRLEHLGP